ncbi:MAG TPA: leucyl/phenylalanyl-tRNA--protein transferase [Desulfobacteraceae bacterium]|nr:leucyl/phenylalanyl-tRNA--protein transferase [Deltaproteobacteria bacterium]RLB97358.1 MAG: leucyl/phenylalanyl-tRNA--protein transferase [Deltaproteobacteria bacterium]HDI59847.1 leucyl/phenylalanyl-tRNA--protein transferase [Desulfobacteraceae bacterium]
MVERFDQRMDFPPVDHALDNGLLAVGGDLSIPRLITAYRRGIFPWFGPGDPILWWSPDPRLVLLPSWLHVPRSLRRVLNQERFAFSLDRDFAAVIHGCAGARRGDGTWLVPEMISAYLALHQAGYAHSLEIWQQGRLAGGIYGVALGNCFFGESMFTRIPDASKAGLVKLVGWLAGQGFELIDCQVTTEHLLRFGAREIRRGEFLERLEHALRAPDRIGRWEFQA